MDTSHPNTVADLGRLRWRHPFITCTLPWLVAVIAILVFLPILYIIASSQSPHARASFFNAFYAFAVGLLLGGASIYLVKRQLADNLEQQARALAFPQSGPTALDRKTALIFLAAIGLDVGFVYALRYFLEIVSPLDFICALIALFTTRIFAYPEHWGIYCRAKELILTSESASLNYENRAKEEGPRLPVMLGVFSSVGLIAIGAWFQFVLPPQLGTEPGEFVTRAELAGQSLRLTYGTQADSPAVSPDGRHIAYCAPADSTVTSLHVMAADGKNKRSINTEIHPSYLLPASWSPDGSLILFSGQQIVRGDLWNEEDDTDTLTRLWLVNLADGTTKNLSDVAPSVFAGFWGGPGKIIALKYMKNEACIVLMNSIGKIEHEFKDFLVLRNPHRLCLYAGGTRLLAAGAPATPGLWQIDLETKEIARISDIEPDWMLATRNHGIVFRASNNAARAADLRYSIGLLIPETGEIHWLVQDSTTEFLSPAVLHDAGTLLFRKRDRLLQDLWALSLADGRRHRLTQGRNIQHIATPPSGDYALIVDYVKFPPANALEFERLEVALWRFTPDQERHNLFNGSTAHSSSPYVPSSQ